MRDSHKFRALGVIAFSAGLVATTFPVTKTDDTDDGICDDDCSLREAIVAANANPGLDDVSVPAGTYLLEIGQLTISDHVSITGADQAGTIVDGNASQRVFNVRGRAVAEISNLTIQNGLQNEGFRFGGGGGGIFNDGDLTLTNCTVSNNITYAYFGGGGGIYHHGDLTVVDSTVSSNHAYGYYGNGGGGILGSGSLMLVNTTVTDNGAGGRYARGGGGIRGSGSDITLTNSTVSNNGAGGYLASGGGIAHEGSGVLTLTNSTVSGNAAYYGGGIADYTNATLTHSTVSDNYAFISGGGISALQQLGTVTLADTIVAGNHTSGIIPYASNCNSSIGINSLGHNLADDESCGLTAPGDLMVADAMLGPLADNGGSNETHALLPDSPAIDAGSPDCPPPATDQRGVARPQGVACDIGAVELEPTTTLVEIDIKPGSDNNPIPQSARSGIPVALLGSDTFDVTDVDLATLAFGPDAAAPTHDLGNADVLDDHLQDVNGDGLIDLVMHFRTQRTGIAPDDREACLTGATLDGTPFEGCDAIRVITGRRGFRR